MAKRVYQFECPNCGTTNQNHFHGSRGNDVAAFNTSLMECCKCGSKFSSRVLDRIYFMGYQHGRADFEKKVDDIARPVHRTKGSK